MEDGIQLKEVDLDKQPGPSILKKQEGEGGAQGSRRRVSFSVAVREHSKDKSTPLADASDVMLELVEGATFLKLRNKKVYERFYFYQPEDACISWLSKKTDSIRSIPVRSITLVRGGKVSKGFNAFDTSEFPERLCMTVRHSGGVLDLVAPDQDTRDVWIAGLNSLKSKGTKKSTSSKHRKAWIKSCFDAKDIDKKGKITLRAAREVLRDMLPFLRDDVLDLRIQNLCDQVQGEGAQRPDFTASSPDATADIGGSNSGDFKSVQDTLLVPFYDFQILFKRLSTRREMYLLMHKYTNEKDTLNAKTLKILLELEQLLLSVTDADASKFIQDFEPIPENRAEGEMGIDGLSRLFRARFAIKRTVTMASMAKNRSVLNYTFNASHNTFISQEQTTSACTADTYTLLLSKGVRSVEVDIWPSQDAGLEDSDSPWVVWHGHTQTSPVPVADVLNAIAGSAFKQSSHPLFVFVEMHVEDEAAQKQLCDLFEQTLGSQLYRRPEGYSPEHPPTLEALENKIVIVGQRGTDKSIQDGESCQVKEYDEYRAYGLAKKKNKKKKKKPSAATLDREHITLQPEWSQLVAFDHVVCGLDVSEAIAKATPWSVCSVSEVLVDKTLTGGQADLLVSLSRKQLVRVFPSPARISSDNFVPSAIFALGCQFVSMNYQTADVGARIAAEFFRWRSEEGVYLKPSFLTEETSPFNPNLPVPTQSVESGYCAVPQFVSLRIISAHQLQCNPEEPRSHIVDPFVHLIVQGLPIDQQKYTTRAIDNNAFDPYWNEPCSFAVHCAPLATVQFVIYDYSQVKQTVLGQACIPVEALKPGFRHIQLSNLEGDVIPESFLFVHIGISALNDRNVEDVVMDEGSLSESKEMAPHPSLTAQQRRMRRASLGSAVKTSSSTLAKLGVQPVDDIVAECNTLLSDVTTLTHEVSFMSGNVLRAAGFKQDGSVTSALVKLGEQIRSLDYSLTHVDNVVQLTFDDEVPSDIKPHADALFEYATSARNLSKKLMAGATNSEELDARLTGAHTLVTEHAQANSLSSEQGKELHKKLQDNIAVFRQVLFEISDLQATLAEQVMTLEQCLVSIRRESLHLYN
eukprot:m.201855 g.201855  ORF g.201855 m.201855 type:complete len:1086 (+) comp14972_c1_seq3:309-3566(+)